MEASRRAVLRSAGVGYDRMQIWLRVNALRAIRAAEQDC